MTWSLLSPEELEALELEEASRSRLTAADVDAAIIDLAAARRRRRYDPVIRRPKGWRPLPVRQEPIEQPSRAWSVGFAIGLRGRLLFHHLTKRHMRSS